MRDETNIEGDVRRTLRATADALVVEDLRRNELAALVGYPVVTVRTRVRRALADLRRELER